MQRKALISSVQPDSIAEELGITSGDAVIQVNGQDFHDLIDLSFAFATETLDLVVEKASGEIVEFDIEKDFDEELGIEFETAVFDGVRRCANHCIFCFVDQMPAGMRQSLYVKDDDYRLSFLYGNFITLSNLMPQDMERIHRLHLSPLYVSIHTTDGELRAKMLNNERAGQIMEQLQRLHEQDIEFHGQIVLCPGFNDGAVLKKTFEDVLDFYPTALSLAAVPVGLTKYREECFSMEGFTPEQAADVIDMVSTWQAECRKKIGKSFIYLADEFYLAANRPLPSSEEYDGFPQLENGVGLVRNFLDEWDETVSSRAAELASAGYDQPIILDLACGVSAAKIIGPLLDKLTIRNLTVRVLPVENHFFGQQITVTGLLTAGDIIEQVKSAEKTGDGLIIPGVALRKGENVFLDEQKPEDVAKALNRPVRAAWSPIDLLELLLNWR